MSIHNRFELIVSILDPYGFMAALFLTAVAIGLDVYAKVRPLSPLYFTSFLFFALFGAFTVGYVFHQIPGNFDEFSVSLLTFGLAVLPFSFFILIGGISREGLRLDLLGGIFTLVAMPLAASLVTYLFVRVQSALWHGILWS